MGTIADIVKQIRTAIFGKDVRENIARGFECIGDDLDNKVVLPTDKHGISGQFLMTNGDGSTRWRDAVSPPTDDQAERIIKEWLDDNPEATTTVEDNSLTINKLTLPLKRKLMKGGIIRPIYVGDYMVYGDYWPGSCIKIGNYFYTLDSLNRTKATEQQTNDGIIRKFDINNNIEVTDYKKIEKMSHANSIAYNPVSGIVYVAPIWDYSSGTETYVNYLYTYDSDLVFSAILDTPSRPRGVSYDHMTDTLYYMDYDRRIYKLINQSEWEYYTTVDFSYLQIRWAAYNQDFAVHNNNFYVSDPMGSILYGELKSGDISYIEGSYYVDPVDSFSKFRLGELEGFEFDSNGHLYASMCIELSGGITNGFIVEIPVGETVEDIPGFYGSPHSVSSGTFTLSESSQQCFALSVTSVRSLNQLPIMITNNNQITRITIPQNNHVVENIDYYVVIRHSFELYLRGHLTCYAIDIYNGQFGIYITDSNNLLTFANENTGLHLYRNAILKISGTESLRVEVPNTEDETYNFISLGGSNYSIFYTRLLPTCVTNNKVLKYAGYPLVNTGVYVATANISYYATNSTITVTSNNHPITGFVTSSSTRLILFLELPKQVPQNSNINITRGTIGIRTIMGYLNGGDTNSRINFAEPGDYTITVSGDSRTLRIYVDSPTEFTNVLNNTPVFGMIYGDLSISFTLQS